ncbi:hypothetical protein PPERSA_05250 [Pseudocohnilembus persalinus]|uniref:DUF4097 domain-containing protein n=1 Tax=Pseudocohnilembus persalinus TaxID=266149 RepID=A0A0V0QY15_PSEPJ|nr:hypothetical protein PPERSA_05250 [Pseudocohnilembus persalinus]|eukprot:KRX07086.1 hypothetical protein PPERSA_05250 [Pseudocohnilembus persalinus]
MRFEYGQGGILDFKSEVNCNIFVETLWDDYSAVTIQNLKESFNYKINESEEGEKSTVEIKNTQKQNQNQEFLKSIVEIPENFNYDIETYGDIIHRKTFISSKLYGDVRAIIKSVEGKFEGSKLACENIEIETNQGDIKISSLDVQNGKFRTKSGQIFAKRLGIPGKLEIENQEGKINLESCYALYRHNKESQISIRGENPAVNMGFTQGNVEIQLQKGKVFIRALDAAKLNIKAKQVRANINQVLEDSLIEGEDIQLHFVESIKNVNIRYQSENGDLIYFKGSSDSGYPTLEIRNIGENGTIVFQEQKIDY